MSEIPNTNSNNQSASPFRWMTDPYSFTTTSILSDSQKNTFGALPRDLIDTSSSLRRLNEKLTSAVPSNVTESISDYSSLQNLKDAGVKPNELLGNYTRSNLNTSYTFSKTGELVFNRNENIKDISENNYVFSTMTSLPSTSTSRSGIMNQSEWSPEPQNTRGGRNTRFDER